MKSAAYYVGVFVQGIAMTVGVTVGAFSTLPFVDPNAPRLTLGLQVGLGIVIGGLLFGITSRVIIQWLLPACKVHPPVRWKEVTPFEKFVSISCAILLVGLSCAALAKGSAFGFVAAIVIFWPPMLIIDHRVKKRLKPSPDSETDNNPPQAETSG